MHSNLSRFRGFCFTLEPLFRKLIIEQWNLMKIIMSCTVRFTFSVLKLTEKYINQRQPRIYLVGSLKTQVAFLVLVLISLYSYYDEDPSKQGKTGERGCPSTLRLIYFEAFTLMSMSLSTQSQPGSELGSSILFLASCLVLGVIKKNFMVGVVVAVLCYMAMNKSSSSDSQREQSRRAGDDGNSLYEESSPLPLIIHASPSLSTPRRRPVIAEAFFLRNSSHMLAKTSCHEPYRNLEYLVVLKIPSPILPRHMSLMKTLNCLSLSDSECSTLLRSGWDFTQALPHLRLLNFRSPESRSVTLLTGLHDELLNFT